MARQSKQAPPEVKPPIASEKEKVRKPSLKQSDMPAYSLEAALKVPRAIADQLGGNSGKPLLLAQAMDTSPGSSGFRMLCSAAESYGLVSGGAKADNVSLTPLGAKIVKPQSEDDVLDGLRQCTVAPRVAKSFYERYSDSPVPKVDIAVNVLETMGVPRESGATAFKILLDNARYLDQIIGVKGKEYFNFKGGRSTKPSIDESWAQDQIGDTISDGKQEDISVMPRSEILDPLPTVATRNVFITHGKNKNLLDDIKNLLEFGDYKPVVAAEQSTVSKPVPIKVMEAMRSCFAAIIHIDDEQHLIDTSGEEVIMLNPNVMIEIGASMALYNDRYVLLVKEGTTLPSNLQGLYQVRYTNDTLDAKSTMSLLKAIKDFKNNLK